MIGQFKRRLIGFLGAALLAGCAAVEKADHLLARHAHDHRHHDGELLVLDPPADYLNHLPDLGLSVIDVTRLESLGATLYHLKIEDGDHPFDARAEHDARFPDVIADVHHHYHRHASGASAPGGYHPRNALGWPDAAPACGEGVHIGVLDGGVDISHGAFPNGAVDYQSFHLRGQKPANIDHGTAVVGIIVGHGEWGGMLPGAKISAANIFHQGKDGPAASAKSNILAIDWLIRQKVKIINMSIGGADNKVLKEIVTLALRNGIVLVAAAGNDGPNNFHHSFPAGYRAVIAVGALDNAGNPAKFTSLGPYVEVAAPGVDIISPKPGGGAGAYSGTSFAAPIVSAILAAARVQAGVRGLVKSRRYLKSLAVGPDGKPQEKKHPATGWGRIAAKPVC